MNQASMDRRNTMREIAKSMEATANSLSTIVEHFNTRRDGVTVEYSDDQKKKAAYALNLCMVSVSQIIDYDDINILEKEYEAILNNLNLEEMPKDEELLNILKELLNVITFFRIQEGDKAIVEKEYQHKIKNAIWNAVPSVGMFIGVSDPFSVGLALASQVGTGYMNYRRAKAEGEFEKEKSIWQLQRSAMEQFNGLRRELFDTAWRLADRYNFPDKYRITERQISRYNAILMDDDYIRKYERLLSIKDSFEAYPPFWYFLGNTANTIAKMFGKDDKEIERCYREDAILHFERFLNETKSNLLREDQLRASCCLEYFELLLQPKDSGSAERLENLLSEAIKASGGVNDVLQICAMDYLLIEKQTKAADILRHLVNERYNETINAQLLSQIYVSQYRNSEDKDAFQKYKTLGSRISQHLLYPMPEKEFNTIKSDNLDAVFFNKQKEILITRFSSAIYEIEKNYAIRFNRILPTKYPESSQKNYPESYFFDGDLYYSIRQGDILSCFSNAEDREDYLERLAQAQVAKQIVDLLNDIYLCEIRQFPFAKENRNIRERFLEDIKAAIECYRDEIDDILQRIVCRELTLGGMEKLLSIRFSTLTEDAFEHLKTSVESEIGNIKNMSVLSQKDTELSSFCYSHHLTYQELSPEKSVVVVQSDVEEDDAPFRLMLLGESAKMLKERNDAKKKMISIITEASDKLLKPDAKKIDILICGTKSEGDLESYIGLHKELKDCVNGAKKDSILAVIDDKSSTNQDWIFTTKGLIRTKGRDPLGITGSSAKQILYQDAARGKIVGSAVVFTISSGKEISISDSRIDFTEVKRLIKALEKVSSDHKDAL